MDWQGFTKRADVAELEKLHNPDYRTQFIQRTLQEFLEGLEESAFNGTQIMAELVRLDFLEIKLIKMSQQRSLYHKKTGIFSDRLDNHILHEGSDNFTHAAHSRNNDSIKIQLSHGWHRVRDGTLCVAIIHKVTLSPTMRSGWSVGVFCPKIPAVRCFAVDVGWLEAIRADSVTE
jgi:hypothetical protein